MKLSKADQCAKVTSTEARRRKDVALARMREIQVQRLEGQLLDRDDVREAGTGMVSKARAVLLAMPGELCDRLAAEADPIRCREMLDKRVREALEKLSGGHDAKSQQTR